VVGFEPSKISIAMTKAFLAVNGGLKTTCYLRTLGATSVGFSYAAPKACAIDDPDCEACQ